MLRYTTTQGVKCRCARTAVSGAFLNVKINGSSYDDKQYVESMVTKGLEIDKKARELEKAVLELVEKAI